MENALAGDGIGPVDGQSALAHYTARLEQLQHQLAGCSDKEAATKLQEDIKSHELYVEVLRTQLGRADGS